MRKIKTVLLMTALFGILSGLSSQAFAQEKRERQASCTCFDVAQIIDHCEPGDGVWWEKDFIECTSGDAGMVFTVVNHEDSDLVSDYSCVVMRDNPETRQPLEERSANLTYDEVGACQEELIAAYEILTTE